MNLLEILKNVPKGTKLYSPIFGEVDLVSTGDVIKVETFIGSRVFLNDGRYTREGECMLFPSRENRDWSAFPTCSFKEGDILISIKNQPFIFDGNISDVSYGCYCGIDTNNDFKLASENWTCKSGVRKATNDEIFKFSCRLMKEGYRWDKYNLKLIPILMPFDRVLVRDKDNERWTANIFSHMDKGYDVFKFKCFDSHYKQCIPYNDGTKYLVGTTNDCPEYYKTW